MQMLCMDSTVGIIQVVCLCSSDGLGISQTIVTSKRWGPESKNSN